MPTFNQIEKIVTKVFKQECDCDLGYDNGIYYYLDCWDFNERVGVALKRILKKIVSQFDPADVSDMCDYSGYPVDFNSTIKNTRGAVSFTIDGTFVDITYGEIGEKACLQKVYTIYFH